MTARRGGILVAAVLLAAYAATLAPGVTFWDAGELIAAAHSLGIPHPPGTPLYILALNVWARAFAFLPYAAATNLFSAACTAVAGGVTAWLVARWMARGVAVDGADVRWHQRTDAWSGVAAGICAGAMSTAWANATETEVYAASLCLAILTIAAGEVAGARDSTRWRLLVAYGFGLGAALHASTLVAAPVAILLASTSRDGRVRVAVAVALSGCALTAMGLATWNGALVSAGIVVSAATVAWSAWRAARIGSRDAPVAALGVLVTAVAASALLAMLARAAHDPAINQGDPSTWSAFADVVARRQYALPGIWPRRAPLWLQLANWFEYADWQFALSLGPTVIPTVARVAVTLAFAALAVMGAITLRRLDPRGWRASALLVACGSVGVVLYLNLRASPSFGWGILPPGTLREARERDYFFVLGFWGWGMWAGVGAMAAARRWMSRPSLALASGLAIAALPIVLNWHAVSRRRHPDATAPTMLARALLESAPPRAVLFVAGDNDSYPLWYLQTVEGVRRDVATVTLPMLAARWYTAELDRRFGLSAEGAAGRPAEVAQALALRASSLGRPIAVAITVPSSERAGIGGCWTVTGMVAVAGQEGPGCSTDGDDLVAVDWASTTRWADRIGRWRRGAAPKDAVDPVSAHFIDVLDCPRRLVTSRADAASTVQGVSLDSLCKRR